MTNAIGSKFVNNADGFTHSGGTTERSLTVTSGNVTLEGGTNTKGDIFAANGTDIGLLAVGTNGHVLTADSTEARGVKWAAVTGTGDVVGPASATDNAIARFDTTTGKLVQNSSVILDDNGRLRIGGADGSAMVDIIGATDSVQGLRIRGDATDALSFSTYITGDSFLRFNFTAAGVMQFGDGTAGGDTNLYRDSANVLKTDDNFVVGTPGSATGSVVTVDGTQTLTNKRTTKRTGTTTSSATPTINTDNVDYYSLTAQAADITSFTTNLSGTPTLAQQLRIDVTGTAARAITWGASFANGPVALPTTTVTTTRLSVLFEYDGTVWRCMASGSTV